MLGAVVGHAMLVKHATFTWLTEYIIVTPFEQHQYVKCKSNHQKYSKLVRCWRLLEGQVLLTAQGKRTQLPCPPGDWRMETEAPNAFSSEEKLVYPVRKKPFPNFPEEAFVGILRIARRGDRHGGTAPIRSLFTGTSNTIVLRPTCSSPQIQHKGNGNARNFTKGLHTRPTARAPEPEPSSPHSQSRHASPRPRNAHTGSSQPGQLPFHSSSPSPLLRSKVEPLQSCPLRLLRHAEQAACRPGCSA